MTKKVTRKQLLKEEDEIISFWSKLVQVAILHRQQLFVGLCIILGIGAAASGYGYYMKRSENTAFSEVSKAISQYDSLLQKDGADAAYQGIKPIFEELLEKYSSKTAGKQAKIIYANMCFEAGNLGKAIELYESALVDFSEVQYLKEVIWNGLGYCYEKKADYPNAIKYFENIPEDSAFRSDALYHLGLLYAKADNPDKSIEAYKKIAEQYPDSVYIDIVKAKTGGIKKDS